MHAFLQKHKVYWSDKQFLRSLVLAIIFLIASLSINYLAGRYVTRKITNSVSDLILDNFSAVDVDGIFVYGTRIFWIFAAAILLYKPRAIPFTLKSIALFTIIRSLFIVLTHLGPFPDQIQITQQSVIQTYIFESGFFFSGHTGLPFLLALIFWDTVHLRVFFLASSLLFGAVVLLGHLHYSIDVLSAYFITFSIYHLAERIFRKDKKLFLSSIAHG